MSYFYNKKMFTFTSILILGLYIVSVFFVFKSKFITEQTTFYDRIFISLSCGVIAFFILIAIQNKVEIESVKPGQIYEYHYSHDKIKNPFDNIKVKKYFRVLDIKDGYVLYEDTVDGWKHSTTIEYFLIESKRIK